MDERPYRLHPSTPRRSPRRDPPPTSTPALENSFSQEFTASQSCTDSLSLLRYPANVGVRVGGTRTRDSQHRAVPVSQFFSFDPRSELTSTRPEKDHAGQLHAFHRFLELYPEYRGSGTSAVKLVLMGGSRNVGDATRVENLHALAQELGIDVSHYNRFPHIRPYLLRPQSQVQFVVNAKYSEILNWLSRASIGLSTMVDEHFGINVVEFMVRPAFNQQHLPRTKHITLSGGGSYTYRACLRRAAPRYHRPARRRTDWISRDVARDVRRGLPYSVHAPEGGGARCAAARTHDCSPEVLGGGVREGLGREWVEDLVGAVGSVRMSTRRRCVCEGENGSAC